MLQQKINTTTNVFSVTGSSIRRRKPSAKEIPHVCLFRA